MAYINSSRIVSTSSGRVCSYDGMSREGGLSEEEKKKKVSDDYELSEGQKWEPLIAPFYDSVHLYQEVEKLILDEVTAACAQYVASGKYTKQQAVAQGQLLKAQGAVRIFKMRADLLLQHARLMAADQTAKIATTALRYKLEAAGVLEPRAPPKVQEVQVKKPEGAEKFTLGNLAAGGTPGALAKGEMLTAAEAALLPTMEESERALESRDPTYMRAASAAQ